MTYRANKIRQGKSIKRHEYSELRRQVALDPEPYKCEYFDDFRHAIPVDKWVCGWFAPRPGYEQDRSKYE